MNLLLFNVNTNLDHPTQAFTTTWIRELAARFHHVTVLCLRTGRIDVPNNVSVYGLVHGSSFSRFRFLRDFYKRLWMILRTEKNDVCFSHMNVHFALLAWPLLRLRRIPILLWYGHRASPIPLRIAHMLVNGVVTSAQHGFQLTSKKVSVIGQGVDTNLFVMSKRRADETDIVSVGRISPIKRLEILIKAAHILKKRRMVPRFRVRIIGDPGNETQGTYQRSLRQLVQSLDMSGTVVFERAIPFEKVPTVYQNAFAAFNGCPTGAPDKAGFEAMSCGVVTVVLNASYRSVLSPDFEWLYVASESSDDVASLLEKICTLTPAARQQIGATLRKRVIEHHSVRHATEQVATILKTLKQQ